MPFGLRRNPVWRDSSNVKRERAVRDGYGIEGMSSDSGILLGIILNFCHFLSDLKGLTLEVDADATQTKGMLQFVDVLYLLAEVDSLAIGIVVDADVHTMERGLVCLDAVE